MHHYRPDETDVFFGNGAPSAYADKPCQYIDRATGALYLNLGGGSTWYQTAGGTAAAGGVGNAGSLLTASRTITAADHGAKFFLGVITGLTITLPTAAAALRGLSFECYVEVAPTSANSGTGYLIVTGNSAEQKMAGLVHSSTGGDADSEAAFTGTTTTFVADTSVIGDWCRVTSCGLTGWSVAAFCNADAGITITG